ARMVSPLGRWKRLEVESGRLMKSELKRILDSGTLSPDVYELVSKSLS
ncbi:MAG: aminopeptidase N, partial [Porticoccaceae bacterium]